MAESFHRLQTTYKIHPEDFVNGRVPGTRATPSFGSREAFLIGHKQAQAGLFQSAIQWLEVALEKYHAQKSKVTARHTEILDWLQYSVWHDDKNAVRALKLALEVQSLDPGYVGMDSNIKSYREYLTKLDPEQLARLAEPDTNRVVSNTHPADQHYNALCRGEFNVVGVGKNNRGQKGSFL